MIYHNLSSDLALEELEPLHAQRVGELIQWHREDYTLVYRAVYSELLVVPEARADAHRQELLEESSHALVGESTVDGETTWYGFDRIEKLERSDFADEATELVELFVNAIVTMPDGLNSEEHRSLVRDFRTHMESFLEAYVALGEDDLASYISRVGIPREKARRDLRFILELYE